jgi:hypothetical protein
MNQPCFPGAHLKSYGKELSRKEMVRLKLEERQPVSLMHVGVAVTKNGPQMPSCHSNHVVRSTSVSNLPQQALGWELVQLSSYSTATKRQRMQRLIMACELVVGYHCVGTSHLWPYQILPHPGHCIA